MRKVLICEQSKEFHNAAALGLFNSAVEKGNIQNENLQKVSKPLTNIELSVQSEGRKLYDKFNIRKVTIQRKAVFIKKGLRANCKYSE